MFLKHYLSYLELKMNLLTNNLISLSLEKVNKPLNYQGN